jgi:predicted metal-dependent peptidase
MCINQAIHSDFIDTTNHTKDFIEIPTLQNGEIWVLMMPKEYKGQHVFEDVYEWLKQEKEKYDDWKKGGSLQNCPISGYLENIFDGMDDGLRDWLDTHFKSDLTKEFRKETVERVKRYLRSRGLEKANIKSTLEKLVKSRKDYLNEIKTAISSLRGYTKEKSISKRNRRSIPGIKGHLKSGFGLNVILDVSGSMGGYFQRALSYIFQNKIIINLIMCDTEVKKQGKRNYIVINGKKEFKKVQIVGLGGTELQPAIDFVSSCKEINKLNTLILTDGYCDVLDVSKLKKTLILTISEKCKIKNGIARQIVVEDDLPAEKNI